MASYWITYEGTRFPVRLGETVVGRSAYCTIVISDGSVSREHASLRLVDGVLKVVDLGSRNGTFVNGERVGDPRALSSGDVVVLGTAAMQIVATTEDPKARSMTMGISGGHTPLPEETQTTASTTTLDLIESMVERAQTSGRPADYMKTLCSMIDNVLEYSRVSGRPLRAGDGERLAAAAGKVSGWEPAGSLAAWSEGIARQVGGR